MAEIVLLGYGLLFLTGFAWKTLRQRARTGDAGIRGLRASSGLAWLASILLTAGTLLPIGISGLEFTGVLSRSEAGTTGLLTGAFLMLAGIVMVLMAQATMGESWRIGVDPGESTALVEGGIFRLLRNPIFAGLVLVSTGAALVLPRPGMILAVALNVLGSQIQVRRVEEPHLGRLHGQAYRDYAARVGRFLPGIRRLRR